LKSTFTDNHESHIQHPSSCAVDIGCTTLLPFLEIVCISAMFCDMLNHAQYNGDDGLQ